MSRRKRKRNSKGWNFSWLVYTIQFPFKMIPVIFPYAAVAGLLFGLLFGAKTLLYADPNLAVVQINIQPPNALPIPLRQKLETEIAGKNIFEVDLKALSRRLTNNPDIQTARIIRRVPSEILIQVEKRKALACIQLAPQGAKGLIAEDGVVLDLMEDCGTYLKISAFELGYKKVTPGLRVQHPGFRETVKFIKTFWAHPMSRTENITEVKIGHLGNLTVRLGDNGPDVKLGRHPSRKMGEFEKIIHWIQNPDRENIDYIDLQFDNVIVKRKTETPKKKTR